jgi:hypothetical protein
MKAVGTCFITASESACVGAPPHVASFGSAPTKCMSEVSQLACMRATDCMQRYKLASVHTSIVWHDDASIAGSVVAARHIHLAPLPLRTTVLPAAALRETRRIGSRTTAEAALHSTRSMVHQMLNIACVATIAGGLWGLQAYAHACRRRHVAHTSRVTKAQCDSPPRPVMLYGACAG